MTYLQILVEDQQDAINLYEQGLRDIENIQRSQGTRAQLAAQEEAARSAKEVLGRATRIEATHLQTINAQVSTDEQQLAKLEADQQRLNQLFEELVSVTCTDTATVPFAERKGALVMPVSGHPPIGLERAATLTSAGRLVDPAEEGAAIRAVHAGQVIYADWLRGQGLLIVIDHQDGWLTLYAQNHSLMRAVGESVTAGEVIAKAGASGGQEMTGCTEIRQQGQLVDPAEWIRR